MLQNDRANLKVDDRACKAYACPIRIIANGDRESQVLDQNHGQRPRAGRQAGKTGEQGAGKAISSTSTVTDWGSRDPW